MLRFFNVLCIKYLSENSEINFYIYIAFVILTLVYWNFYF